MASDPVTHNSVDLCLCEKRTGAKKILRKEPLGPKRTDGIARASGKEAAARNSPATTKSKRGRKRGIQTIQREDGQVRVFTLKLKKVLRTEMFIKEGKEGG